MYPTSLPWIPPNFSMSLSLRPRADPMIIIWSSTLRFSNKHRPRKSHALHTAFLPKRPIHHNKDGAVYLTGPKCGSQSRNRKRKPCNDKRAITRVTYHFGFWMHRLDLGRRTGVAEVWTLHSQEVGVHWHLSLHLRQKKATVRSLRRPSRP